VAGKRAAGCVVQALQFEALIFGQGFGGEQVNGAGGGVRENSLHDALVVAERFAARGRSNDDYVFAGECSTQRGIKVLRKQPNWAGLAG
jgi:hypothetical protein